MVGRRTEHYRAFGWGAARFDDVVNLVPAPLSGLLLVVAALFAGDARAGPALRIMLRDGRKHHSPNAGWPEAAMAGALGLALAGPRQYAAGAVNDPWLGDGTPFARPADIIRALPLVALAGLVRTGLTV